MYCSKCGAQIPDDARLCPYCGAPTVNSYQEGSLQGSLPPPLPVTGEKKKKKKKKKKKVDSGLIVAGYILAILIPIVGLGIGIYVASKDESGHGGGIIALSIGMWLLYMFMW